MLKKNSQAALEVHKRPGCFYISAWLFLPDIKFRVECIEIPAVEMVFYNVQPFAETLEMHDFAFSQETDWVADFRVFDKAQDIVIGSAGFLFCCDLVKTTVAGNLSLTDNVEMKLDEADKQAATMEERLSHETVFSNVRSALHGK